MPELPEVETIKRDLQANILNCTMEDVFVFDQRILKNITLTDFIIRLKGAEIKSITRKSKAIVIELNTGFYLIIQLGMTGHMILSREFNKENILRETKLVFMLSQGMYLYYNDHRLFGKWHLVKDLEDVHYIRTSGPDPFNGTFSPQWLTESLKGKKAPIKNLLMNQTFIGGIGNIYASEILFASRIHPQKKGGRLTSNNRKILYHAIQDVLKEAIEYRGTSLRNYRVTSGEKGEFINRIKVYGRENEPCVICGASIKRIVQAGRSTFFCGKCQK